MLVLTKFITLYSFSTISHSYVIFRLTLDNTINYQTNPTSEQTVTVITNFDNNSAYESATTKTVDIKKLLNESQCGKAILAIYEIEKELDSQCQSYLCDIIISYFLNQEQFRYVEMKYRYLVNAYKLMTNRRFGFGQKLTELAFVSESLAYTAR